ncbi:hypothetical protein ACWKWP_15160 [Agromyces soli]
MDLTQWLRAEHGIGHASDAARLGASRTEVDRAVKAGRVRRVRRSWLALADVESPLIAAAEAGGRLTCASAARHLGLWTFDDARLHISVPKHAGRADASAVRHWSTGPVVPHRFELVEPIENILAHAATCLSPEGALVIWESAIRKRLTRIEILQRLPFRSARARELLAGCSMLSDSGIETVPVARLARIGVAVRQQEELLGHRVDGLIGDRLVYQIDGYAFHQDAAQRRRDIAHDRQLTLSGYIVLRYDYAQILFDWPSVEREIRLLVAQGAHLVARHPPIRRS